MNVYYNEHDRFAAEWLRGLIAGGHLPAGHVDERDIQDVQPGDLAGFQQCHFFAGIGGWAYALELAGWGDRPVWTGSCPCQPYSSAGKGEGAADARNLWPAWFRLIRECRPVTVFGEQVEAAVRHGWLDAVSSDMEAEGYAFGAVVLGAHSVGAPHIRQRAFFVADRGYMARPEGRSAADRSSVGAPREIRHERIRANAGASGGGQPGRMADAELYGLTPDAQRRGAFQGEVKGWMLQPEGRCPACRKFFSQYRCNRPDECDCPKCIGLCECRATPWTDLEWLLCRGGKARPTRAGLQPLAHGVPNRVGALRGAGNAIVPQAAEAFIRAYLETVA